MTYTYAKAEHQVFFDAALLPDGMAAEKRTKAMQQELADKEAA